MRRFRLVLVVLGLSLYLGHTHAQATLSAGCGKMPPRSFDSLVVDGQARNFILSVPEAYDVDTPHALVFAFHGRTSPAAEVARYYDLEPHATKTLGPTIFVYPVALRQPDGTFSWWESGDSPEALLALFDALLKQISEHYCIDKGRIYAVGHSLGGSFVNALGCHRAEVLRAVASLGAGPGGGTCQGKVAAMVLHNPNDGLVAFELGLAARDQYLRQNKLSGPPTATTPRSLKCERYGPAGTANLVLWCPHTHNLSYGRYYPHNWPDETGVAVMRFFAALPPVPSHKH